MDVPGSFSDALGASDQKALPGQLPDDEKGEFSHADAKRVLDRINHICGGNGSNSFVGGQPVSFSMASFGEVIRKHYVACEKTDGIRYLLFGAAQRIFLIGRKNEVRQVSNMYLPTLSDIRVPQQLTLLDGELVLDRPENSPPIWRYLIYDAIAIERDYNIRTLNLLQRLSAVKEYVIEPLRKLEQDPDLYNAKEKPFEIYLKDFFEVFDLKDIQQLSLRLPHPSDGIIFTPVDLPYKSGTCKTLYKWKPPYMNTVDFSIEVVYDLERVPHLFKLYANSHGVKCNTGSFLAPYGTFYPQLFREASYENTVLKMRPITGLIVECYWYPSSPVYTFFPSVKKSLTLKEERLWASINGDSTFYDFDNGSWVEGGWVAERVRTDKLTPNDMRVVKSVKQSIEDGIGFSRLISTIENAKSYKTTVAALCRISEKETEQ